MFQIATLKTTSNAFTRYANYYSITDKKRGIGVLVALQAKHLKIRHMNINKANIKSVCRECQSLFLSVIQYCQLPIKIKIISLKVLKTKNVQLSYCVQRMSSAFTWKANYIITVNNEGGISKYDFFRKFTLKFSEIISFQICKITFHRQSRRSSKQERNFSKIRLKYFL